MYNVKYIVLVLLVFQTSITVLILRYIRISTTPELRYLSSTLVFMVEVVKATSCVIIILFQTKFNLPIFFKHVSHGMLNKPSETFKMLIPAALYAMQNNLLHIALTHLDAATFQVTYQMKILTTAMFSVVLLKRNLSSQQWLALFSLTIGIGFVQLSDVDRNSLDLTVKSHVIGLIVVATSSLSSSFAGVYFEMLLKQCSLSLWIRNLQMAMFCMGFAALAMLSYDSGRISLHGFFQGYNIAVVLVLIFQAIGGLLVAFAVQYSDNIVKAFASSISVILSSAISYLILDDLQLDWTFVVGTSVVLVSSYLYGRNSPSKEE